MSFDVMIAVAKGRILDATERLWMDCGLSWPIEPAGRQLWFPAAPDGPGLIVARARDVSTLVARGIADFGIVGLDVLEEHPEPGVMQVLDLDFARCRVVLAGRTADWPEGPVQVATKYPRITQDFFHKRHHPVDLVRLSGSLELAPVLGLAPYIVDIVDTGRTLLEHGLVAVETLFGSSARLVVNPAAWRTRPPVREVYLRFKNTVAGKGRGEHA